MTAREETIVLRDAASVYAEGVVHGLEKALSDLKRGRSINESLSEWRQRYDAAREGDDSLCAGGGS